MNTPFYRALRNMVPMVLITVAFQLGKSWIAIALLAAAYINLLKVELNKEDEE